MTESGPGCSQLLKTLVVGESDSVETGGGSSGRREGHLVKAGDSLHHLSLSLSTTAVLKFAKGTQETCCTETLFFQFVTKVESEKEKPSLLFLYSASLLHSPSSLNPLL